MSGGKQQQEANVASTTVVWLFNAQRGDFDPVTAARRDADTYELVEPTTVEGYDTGDLVRCEMSDGELIVRSRIYSPRLL